MITTLSALAQDKKVEKEKDINADRMPGNSLEFLMKNIPEKHRKLRFYYETDGEKESYEAKFKHSGSRFSVEFSSEGILEDVEVEADDDELEKSVLKNIKDHLKDTHERFKIEKIQFQYVNNDNPIETMQRAKQLFSTPDHYELIVATKNKGKLKKYEMTFDAQGKFEKQREIIRNSYDYLIF